ncbi:hypothetical protein SUGI_0717060 [Cryptomeria japonica]|nr:hypothetical protein SUGI_0717060 [Cryptomeria japonica]
MSQLVYEKGERTLADVSKVDKAPEGVLEKVTDNSVNIGLGYVCVRNRVGNETISEARQMEYELFTRDPDLSKIDKNMVGIPVLAKKLMQIQAMSISKCLPDILKKIDPTLSKRQSELNALPRNFSNYAEAMIEFMRLMDSIKGMLHKLLVQGDIELFPDETEMHCIACLYKMFESYSHDLSSSFNNTPDDFLVEEVKLLEEAQGVSLPNFLPHSVLVILLQSRIESISERSRDLAIMALYRQESRQNWEAWKKTFLDAIKRNYNTVKLEGIGEINLKNVPKDSNQLDAAFDMKMSVMAYWSVVKMRFVDEIPLHIRFTFHKMVEDDIVNLVVKEVLGSAEPAKIGDILEESPKTATKRRDPLKRIAMLRESKYTLSKIINKLGEA